MGVFFVMKGAARSARQWIDLHKMHFRLCENKGLDQLCSHCEADKHLCFRYTDSTISPLVKSEIASF